LDTTTTNPNYSNTSNTNRRIHNIAQILEALQHWQVGQKRVQSQMFDGNHETFENLMLRLGQVFRESVHPNEQQAYDDAVLVCRTVLAKMLRKQQKN
jgi:hypothetical protein